MGQQQLLLIVLGVIIVGVAIVMGINLFQANAVEAKRNNVTNELVNLAAMAQQFYQRPSTLGGGNRTFTGWQIPAGLTSTANGSYKIKSIDAQQIVVIGTGNEVVTGADSVQVQIAINPSTYLVEIIH